MADETPEDFKNVYGFNPKYTASANLKIIYDGFITIKLRALAKGVHDLQAKRDLAVQRYTNPAPEMTSDLARAELSDSENIDKGLTEALQEFEQAVKLAGLYGFSVSSEWKDYLPKTEPAPQPQE